MMQLTFIPLSSLTLPPIQSSASYTFVLIFYSADKESN